MLEFFGVVFIVGIIVAYSRYKQYRKKQKAAYAKDAQVASRPGWMKRMRTGGFLTPRRVLVLSLVGILVVMYFTHPVWTAWLWDNLWKGEGHQKIFFGTIIAITLSLLLFWAIATPGSALAFMRKYWWAIIGAYAILIATALFSGPEKWIACWEKSPTQTGKRPELRGACYDAVILSEDNRLKFMVFYPHKGRLRSALFEGQVADDDHYTGTWSQEEPGDAGRWELTKVGSVFHGWHTDKTGKGGIPFLLKPKERRDKIFERT
ncbi:hypothetical protein IIA94_01270 [Patescibacteria group bacterium]|nr:hypothetical protein [Patescibacteria group bacterium]